tara:strand:+ start:394 stop:630 length:237 start_codon:yes stop_codon:yes gene_type:complete
MDEQQLQVFFQVGVGFMIVKMLFDTIVSAQVKLRNGRQQQEELIPISEWRELKRQVTDLRVEMGQIKTLLRGTINGKT